MAFCTKCGTNLPDNANFCFKCGTPTATATASRIKIKSRSDNRSAAGVAPASTAMPPRQRPPALDASAFTWQMSARASGVQIHSIKMKVSNVVIPETVDGYPVVEVLALYYYTHKDFSSAVKSIDLPDTVEIIGEQAFENTNITSIVLPRNLRQIGTLSFRACRNLKTVVWNDLLDYIGNYAFHESGITEITLPESLLKIGYGAFSNCGNLSSVKMPSHYVEICRPGYDGFQGSGMPSIGAFSGCHKLSPASKEAINAAGYSDSF